MKTARLAVLLVALALLTPALPSMAQDPVAELQQVQNELWEVEQAIRAAQTEASSVGRQVVAAQAAMALALDGYHVAQALVDQQILAVQQTESQVASLEGQVETLERALAKTAVELSTTEQRLEETAINLYMAASAVPGVDLFSQASVADAAAALAYSSAVFDQDTDVFTAFELLQREEERQRDQIVEKQAQTEAELRRLEEEKANLEIQRDAAANALAVAQAEAANVQELLDSIQRDIASAEEHKDGLEADAAALELEIARLSSGEGTAPSGLSWPVNGAVTSPFGYRVHPILGVRKLHTGIDITAASGAPIAASAAGTVILAQTYGGYGRTVVIDHGGGLTTLYAHQSQIAVSVGQIVGRGALVGYVGCSGSCTGPHLHYEVREDGVPVDPLSYLR
ncbi:MAG: M23 family metallopeptidase [Acidimicrobiia bacterium]|nr:M23 family metallopeptidase [Acidimicrobiia bacterium]MDQ3500716.1 M23 family metallopeptidase [Actinomycetota bacterium]